MRRRVVWSVFAAAIFAAPLAAQTLRGMATSTARYMQLRPIVSDSVPLSEVEHRPDGDYHNGVRVTCVAGFRTCARHVAGDVEDAWVLTQDVSVTAWGLGMRGLSGTVLLRARADAGEFDWPRGSDSFDAILAYAELDRGTWRVRLGRQRASTGLGFAGFDGASVAANPASMLQVEAFGGRSLARGLQEPRNEALRGVESFLPDRQAWLLGGSAWFEPWAGSTLTARYQREIWSDRSGLLSERASLDFRTILPASMSLHAAADYDFAFGRIGKANLTVRAPVRADRSLWVEAMGRRHVPYFELWTIWGFFEPAAWHEAELRASWNATPQLHLSGYGGWRFHEDTQTEVILSKLPDESQRFGLSALWEARPDLTIGGDYAMERGFGAFLSSGNLFTRYQANERLSLSLSATAFQQIEEFRVGEGTVFGIGAGLAWDFNSRTAVDAGYRLYRQTFEGRPGQPDWNQSRAWAALRVGFGEEPRPRARPETVR